MRRAGSFQKSSRQDDLGRWSLVTEWYIPARPSTPALPVNRRHQFVVRTPPICGGSFLLLWRFGNCDLAGGSCKKVKAPSPSCVSKTWTEALQDEFQGV